MHEIEQSLISVREVFVNIPKRYEDAKEALRKCENEHQDLLHVIEFASLDAVKMAKTLKELREIRQERRRLKDELEILEAAKELISYPKPSDKNINRVIGNVRHVLKKQNSRTYTMRVRKDLQELIK